MKKNSSGSVSNTKVDSKEKVSTLGSGSNVETNLEIKQADRLEKDKVSNEIQSNTVDKSKSVSSKLLGDKESGDVETGAKKKDVEVKSKGDKEGVGAKGAVKEENLGLTRKGSFRGEQCDSDFKCTIGNGENDGMVACLSVPGDGMDCYFVVLLSCIFLTH